MEASGATQEQLFVIGGKAPTTASITLTGGAIEKAELLDDMVIEKGQVVRFSGYAKVNDVGGKDIEDPKTGITTKCEKRHKARILELNIEEVVPDHLPEGEPEE